MANIPSVWHLIINASFIVKLVILILFLASILSWAIMIQKFLFFKQLKHASQVFDHSFWSTQNLTKLYQEYIPQKDTLTGMSRIFYDGFTAFSQLSQRPTLPPDRVLDNTQRAMRIAQSHETIHLEQNLAFLATVGSTSPYIGLFGTVWGIMTAFRGLGAVQQATISMVAPGISEALIATAMGLFAAIPAVIAYNRFTNELEKIQDSYVTFQEEFLSVLHQDVYRKPQEK